MYHWNQTCLTVPQGYQTIGAAYPSDSVMTHPRSSLSLRMTLTHRYYLRIPWILTWQRSSPHVHSIHNQIITGCTVAIITHFLHMIQTVSCLLMILPTLQPLHNHQMPATRHGGDLYNQSATTFSCHSLMQLSTA